MKILLDPRFFSYVIMALYTLNGIQYAVRREWGHAGYWLGAFWITASVTFGMK